MHAIAGDFCGDMLTERTSMDISPQLHNALTVHPIELTVFQPVALELLQLVAEPDINFFNVIRTIKEDQALSAHVLKMANSPSYMGRSRCETIENAAIRLGTQQIANIAIAASHASVHASDDPVVHDTMQDLWLHSHACALGCRSIALRTGHQSFADHAYLAGLLHDIGKLYLVKALEHISHDQATVITLDRNLLLTVFSEMHVEMGCRIMDHLNLPQIYCDVVALHHSPYSDTDDILLSLVRLVNVNSRKFQLSLYPTHYQNENVIPELGSFKMDEPSMSKLKEVMTGSMENQTSSS
jgi:putative nucleotidyltransferase with HDIG domain